MIDSAGVSAPRRVIGDAFARRSSPRSVGSWRWDGALAVAAVAAAAVAVWVTLRASFLAYPGWLAVQKADFIVGPIAVGLYWRHKRPRNHLGSLMIVLGLFGVPYILESSSNPTLFSVGSLTEFPLWLTITIVTLAFPSGRLESLPEWLIIAVLVGEITLVSVLFAFPPHVAGFTISTCHVLCPGQHPTPSADSAGAWLFHQRIIPVMSTVIALSTAGAIALRFATGTPPRRRALAIGTPIALLFMLVDAAYRGLFIFAPNGLAPSARPIQDVLQWADAATRSLVWYGFLFALIAAELFAGRVLRDVARGSLGRPSLRELEGMLRGPLGDPGMRLGFWRPATRDWADADGAVLAPRSGQALTEVQREDRPAAAIVHDAQLSEDPELLEAAGAVALMALENAELEAAWRESMRELEDSRMRITEATDRERRKLERDLHDGAQQRLVAVQVRLRLLQEAVEGSELDERLEAIRVDAEQAVEDLRTLAHGIYPPLLRDRGLGDALRSLAMRAPIPIEAIDEGIGRCSAPVEAGIYFCLLEAVQNAIKHAGGGAHVTVVVGRNRDEVYFSVADDGVGMAVGGDGDGMGLVGMRDRIGAVGGVLEVVSTPGVGTTVRGTVPTNEPSPSPARFAESSG
jgi:signal transduction histidine kinase